MGAPKVSVIIPVHEAGEFLGRSISSVFEQRFEDIELIVVDDASGDDTREWIRSYEEKAELPFRSIFLDENGGAPHARNVGMKEAQGTFLQFLDADDLLEKGKIGHQVELIERDEADLVIGDYQVQELDGELREIKCHAYEADPWLGSMRTRLGNTCSNLWRKGLVEKVGGWNEGMKSSQEYELLFRCLKDGASLVFDPKPLTRIFKRGSASISGRGDRSKWTQYIGLRQEILGFLREQKGEGALSPYYQAFFEALRNLSPHDPELATELFKKELPQGFTPDKSLMTPFRYRILFGILGFEKTEKLFRKLKKV